jgi:hypothetical protein
MLWLVQVDVLAAMLDSVQGLKRRAAELSHKAQVSQRRQVTLIATNEPLPFNIHAWLFLVPLSAPPPLLVVAIVVSDACGLLCCVVFALLLTFCQMLAGAVQGQDG